MQAREIKKMFTPNPFMAKFVAQLAPISPPPTYDISTQQLDNAKAAPFSETWIS